jgi:hypothetical protein
MRYAKFSALGILAATLCCGSALAQETYQLYQNNEARNASPQQPDTQTIDFYVAETYDSNITHSDEAIAESRGLKQADFYTNAGFDATVIQTLGRQRFFVAADGDFQWYAHDHPLNDAFAHFSGGDTIRLGQCGFTVDGDYYRKRTNDVAFISEAVDNVATTGSVGAELGCQKTFGIAPSVGVVQRWNTNSTELFKEANNEVLTVTGGLDYRNGILGSLGLYAEYDGVRFDNAFLNIDGQLYRDAFHDWSWGGRFYKQFDPRFSLSAIVTYTTVGSNIPSGPHFDGLTYSIIAVYNPGPHLFAHADISRQVLPSNQPFATFEVNQQYEADIGYTFNRFLRLSASGAIEDWDYHETTSLVPLFHLSSQRLYTAGATAAFNVNDHLWFDLFVVEQHGDVNIQNADYWSTQVGLRARVTFGRRS